MKRHKALIPLSKEHHEGLLLAVRLQQGPKALQQLWSHDPFWQADYVVKFFEEYLDEHFDAEEQFVFPLFSQHIKDHQDVVQKLKIEHDEMRSYFEFFKQPDEKKLECNLTGFGKLLEEHIRCEERELFPLVEQHLPESILETLNQQLQNHNK